MTDTIPCKWCGEATNFIGAEMCDDCWELNHRIPGKEEIVIKMLTENGYGLASLGPKTSEVGDGSL